MIKNLCIIGMIILSSIFPRLAGANPPDPNPPIKVEGAEHSSYGSAYGSHDSAGSFHSKVWYHWAAKSDGLQVIGQARVTLPPPPSLPAVVSPAVDSASHLLYTYDPAAGQLDLLGMADAIVATYTGHLLPNDVEVTIEVPGLSTPIYVDVDRDGDPDIIFKPVETPPTTFPGVVVVPGLPSRGDISVNLPGSPAGPVLPTPVVTQPGPVTASKNAFIGPTGVLCQAPYA